MGNRIYEFEIGHECIRIFEIGTAQIVPKIQLSFTVKNEK
jgi:hypothetical protein